MAVYWRKHLRCGVVVPPSLFLDALLWSTRKARGESESSWTGGERGRGEGEERREEQEEGGRRRGCEEEVVRQEGRQGGYGGVL